MNPLVIDAMLALLVAGHALASVVYRVSAPEVALLLAGTLCLIWRRRAPLAVLSVSSAVFCAFLALGPTAPPLPFAPAIALYTVAARSALPVSIGAAGALAIGVVVGAIVQPGHPPDDDFLDYLVALGAAGTLGYGVRLSRARTALLEEQAAQLEREQAVKTRLAVEQEQARIARELHDIVAHNVSVIVAQAGATKRVFDTEPELARQALGSIESIGREALIEMRRLLGVVRTDKAGKADRERAPQPGLGQLPTLVAQVEQAGLPVQLIVRGNPRPLPAGVELNAYRIVQEALTNTLKHAGPTRAEVVLSHHAEFLELRIRDEGSGSPRDLTTGNGLVGMRQRAALLGGEVAVGPLPGDGFLVTATLPVNGEVP